MKHTLTMKVALFCDRHASGAATLTASDRFAGQPWRPVSSGDFGEPYVSHAVSQRGSAAQVPTPPLASSAASITVVPAVGEPRQQHAPAHGIFLASNTPEVLSYSVSGVVDSQKPGFNPGPREAREAGGLPSAQRQAAAPPPNPFAAITAWDEAAQPTKRLAARAEESSAKALAAAAMSAGSETAPAAVADSEAARRFSAPGFAVTGRPATASVGEIRLAVAAAIAAQTADAVAFARIHSSSSSNPSGGGSSSDGAQSGAAAGGVAAQQRPRDAGAPLASSAGGSPSGLCSLAETIVYEASVPTSDGPRVAAHRQTATAPVDIRRTVHLPNSRVLPFERWVRSSRVQNLCDAIRDSYSAEIAGSAHRRHCR